MSGNGASGSRARAWYGPNLDDAARVQLIVNELDEFSVGFDEINTQIESVKQMTRVRLNLIAGIGLGILTGVIGVLVSVVASS